MVVNDLKTFKQSIFGDTGGKTYSARIYIYRYMHVFWFQIIAWFSSLFGQCYQWHIKVEFFPEIYCSYLIKGFFPWKLFVKSICGQLSRASHLTTDVNTQSLISSDFFHSVRKGREGKGREICIYRNWIPVWYFI